jgi:transaldolase
VIEARRLFAACGRPNVMVKIPGTPEGIDAIRQCLSEGININITLLFSIERYREVVDAYLAAMEERVSKGRPVDRVQSVASFFVSRVDANVDAKLERIAGDTKRSDAERALARSLAGKIAIQNARLAYEAFEEAFRHGARFAKLLEAGARMQRPLWASTSTKNPSYPELIYVEQLVAPDTVDTMPPKTFHAYRSRGAPRVRIYDDRPFAHQALRDLATLGIDMKVVAGELEEEGVRLFANSYDALLSAVANKERAFAVAPAP